MDSVRVSTLPNNTFRLPPHLEGLRRLAYNLWWTWHPSAKSLFARVDHAAWQRYRNPIAVLSGPIDWDDLLVSPDFMAEYHDVLASFDRYMANGADHWYSRRHRDALTGPIAYFCAEYGFDESIGIYSGGLGILAGDHTKSASDMALPFVGIGLLYRKGYFRQTIDADGHQEHAYPDYDLSRLPLQRVQGMDGQPLQVQVELPDRNLTVAVWCAQVGRVPILLLDTDTPENDQSDRPITHILYVRGREMRLYQEMVLGVGGVRALRALGVEPAAWHLNEGHSAFLLAERARELVADGSTIDEALDLVKRDSVFTIHTPVSAGNERFEADLVRRVAGPLLEGDGRPGHRRRSAGTAPRAGDRRRRRDRPVRHDRVQPPPHVRGQRREPAARPHGQRDVAGDHQAADPRDHERRPHPDLGRRFAARALRTLPARRSRRSRRQAERDPLLGAHEPAQVAGSLGRRTSARSAR